MAMQEWELATKRIHQILQEEKPNYFIRGDIKSFYSSIPHYKLLQDITKIYNDPKLIKMPPHQKLLAPLGYLVAPNS